MPELPEVETVVRALRQPLIGRTIADFVCYWANQLVIPDDEAVWRVQLAGRTVTAVGRRAKYIVITLDDGAQTLLVHLKMTGHLALMPNKTPLYPHLRQRFVLTDGHDLRFRDTRKFGRLYLLDDPQVVLGKLGPEPLDPSFTVALFQQRLAGKKRRLKPLLLDQTFVAGIGNIYADEALFYAGLHPLRLAHTLDSADIGRLHQGIRQVLQLGIAREGASIDSYVKPDGAKGAMQDEVKVFRRTGHPCYTCGATIERLIVGGRSTHICAVCQK